MKKVIAIIVLFFVGVMVVTCSKPKISKEQQDNIATRIYRNYDIQEIEFLSFTQNESTGTYYLRITEMKKKKRVYPSLILVF